MSSSAPTGSSSVAVPDDGLRRGQRYKNLERFAAGVDAEKRDESGNLPSGSCKTSTKNSKRKKSTRAQPPADIIELDDDEDEDDKDYGTDASDSGEDDSEGEDDEDMDGNQMIDNDELADILPSKTVAERTSKGKKPSKKRKKPTQAARAKKKSRSVTIEEVEDVDASPRVSQPAKSTAARTEADKPEKKKQNPIFLFFEEVSEHPSGKHVKDNRYYKCYHGDRKVLTITKKMKYSANGLISHIEHNVNTVYRQLYEVLKARKTPPTQEECDIASGKISLGSADFEKYKIKLKEATTNIFTAFQKQMERSRAPWDQKHFEKLLAQWLVTCDQPFDEVDKPELRALLEFVHNNSSGETLQIPHRTSMKTKIMKLGKDTIKDMREMFSELKQKVSISLDAWTSSNQIAFLAIIAHYVTNDGQLEETLIDFRELIGEHSGENMAEAVWDTLSLYGLQDKILAFVMDNATNNDTLIREFETHCISAGIDFSAEDSRLRCMPHTIHLAALKLLEGVGALSSRDAEAASGSYQETVTLPVDRDIDNSTVFQDDGIENTSADIACSVARLRKIVRAVRVSPQRRRSWLSEVTASLTDDVRPLMLILDVKTRWSSTHQMLRRAIDFKKAINDYVAKDKDLRQYELDDLHWEAIELVSGWLKSFRSATTQMSATKHSTISTCLAIFRGLQDELKDILRKLPSHVPAALRKGVLDAHRKLSDYYTKYDDSPFYTWACLLDPRIGYETLKEDYEKDAQLKAYLETSKKNLAEYFKNHYKPEPAPSTPPASTLAAGSGVPGSPQKVDFLARFHRRGPINRNELEEFWRLPREDFKSCDPIAWWVGRRSQFPNLSRLALDILSIPGSAVAVERVFSAGRDTISIRRACKGNLKRVGT